MTFDPHSLDLLRQLGRKLPQALPKTELQNKSKVETEKNIDTSNDKDNPKLLFQKLIEESIDGKIAPHLINKLREVEEKQTKESVRDKILKPKNNFNNTTNKTNKIKNFKTPQKNTNEDDYTLFRELLEEEEED